MCTVEIITLQFFCNIFSLPLGGQWIRITPTSILQGAPSPSPGSEDCTGERAHCTADLWWENNDLGGRQVGYCPASWLFKHSILCTINGQEIHGEENRTIVVYAFLWIGNEGDGFTNPSAVCSWSLILLSSLFYSSPMCTRDTSPHMEPFPTSSYTDFHLFLLVKFT